MHPIGKVILIFLATLFESARGDFGVWRIQESVVGSSSFDHPMLTGGNFQTDGDVYNYSAHHAYCYDLRCSRCNSSDVIDHVGGKLYVGDSLTDQGFRLKFEALPDGEGKVACSQLLFIRCDGRILQNGVEEVGGCEFGGHALSFNKNTMGVSPILAGLDTCGAALRRFGFESTRKTFERIMENK